MIPTNDEINTNYKTALLELAQAEKTLQEKQAKYREALQALNSSLLTEKTPTKE
jgi:hypothetical protein